MSPPVPNSRQSPSFSATSSSPVSSTSRTTIQQSNPETAMINRMPRNEISLCHRTWIYFTKWECTGWISNKANLSGRIYTALISRTRNYESREANENKLLTTGHKPCQNFSCDRRLWYRYPQRVHRSGPPCS